MNRPSPVLPPRAVILDYGNVLTWPQADDVIESMARRLDVAVSAFTEAYWQHRRPYDAGDYTGAQYWRHVLGSLGRPEHPDEPTLRAWLIGRDGDSWMRLREEIWGLTRRLRQARVRTAMLSNMTVDLAASIRQRRRLEDWFDAVVVSAEVRVVKPDPRIYRLCLDRLDVDAAGAVFVDDRPENVEAAAALGLRTVHFAGEGAVAALRAALGRAAPEEAVVSSFLCSFP